jgi:hypothetical protein
VTSVDEAEAGGDRSSGRPSDQTADSEFSVDRMNAEMAVAAELDRLRDLNADLEIDNRRLRAALAAVQRAAADGISPPLDECTTACPE